MSPSPITIVYTLCIVALVTIKANPIPDKNKEIEMASTIDKTSDIYELKPGKRQQRQGYFNPYEYYDNSPSYPSYGDYNYGGAGAGAASAQRDYNYYDNQQAYYYHRPSFYGNGNKKNKKSNNRRKFRPFEATSQKYTVWDLARK